MPWKAGLFVALVAVLVLFLVNGSHPVPFASSSPASQRMPRDWQEGYLKGNVLYAQNLTGVLMPSIGNGFLATFVGSTDVFVAGLYNGRNLKGIQGTPSSHRARVPSFLNFFTSNATIDFGTELGGFAMNLEEAAFTARVFVDNVPVQHRLYCHQHYRWLMVHEVTIDNSNNLDPVSIPLLQTNGGPSSDLNMTVWDVGSNSTTYSATVVTTELPDISPIGVGITVTHIPSSVSVPKLEKKTFFFLMTVRTNITGDATLEDPWTASQIDFKSIQKLLEKNPSLLFEEHRASWQTIWSHGGIEIDGDIELARVVNSSLFWILMSHREDWQWSLSPGSLASNGYNGHVFWDTETWMQPTINMLFSERSKSLLEYRINHIVGAELKARSYNNCLPHDIHIYDCIVLPKASQFSRMPPTLQDAFLNLLQTVKKPAFSNQMASFSCNDVVFKHHSQDCFSLPLPLLLSTSPPLSFVDPLSVDPDPDPDQDLAFDHDHHWYTLDGNCGYRGTMFPWESAFTGTEVCPCIAGGTCWYEQHITGDIAFAADQYWRTTRDLEWLKTKGFSLFRRIATFWASRVQTINGTLCINGIIPPDEYAIGVNQSVYTNVIAKKSLQSAIYFSKLLGVSFPSEWETIQQNIPVLFDQERGIHPEYEGYTNETIKQADVILLGFPLMYNMTKQVRQNDLEFYSGVVDQQNGPAMTWSMTAIGYLELSPSNSSFLSIANSYFQRSYANAHSPFYVWTETPTGGTVNFITGAGGFLQGVVFGYGGMRIVEDGLTIGNTQLPPKVNSIKVRRIDLFGNEFDLLVNSTSFGIFVHPSGASTRLCADSSPLSINQFTFFSLNKTITITPC